MKDSRFHDYSFKTCFVYKDEFVWYSLVMSVDNISRESIEPLLSKDSETDSKSTTNGPFMKIFSFVGFEHNRYLDYQKVELLSLLWYFFSCRGMVLGWGIISLSQVSFCQKSIHANSKECQIISIIAGAPYCCRGVIAILFNRISRYRHGVVIQKMTLSFFTLFSCACLILLATQDVNYIQSAILLATAVFSICFLDVFFNGLQAGLISHFNNAGFVNGADLQGENQKQTIINRLQASQQLGALVAASFVGEIADNYNPKNLYIVAGLLVCSNIFSFFFLNTKSYDKKQNNETEPPPQDTNGTEIYFIFLASMVAVLGIVNIILNIVLHEQDWLMLYMLSSFLVLLSSIKWGDAWFNLQREDTEKNWNMENFKLYSIVLICWIVTYINIFGVESYFFTQKEECSEYNPRFSFLEFNTLGGILSSFFALGGTLSYDKLIQGKQKKKFDTSNDDSYTTGYTIRDQFLLVVLISLTASTFDVYMPLRIFNLTTLNPGFYNLGFFILSYTIIGPFVSGLNTILRSKITLQLNPEKINVLSQATSLSIQSYAFIISAQIGLLSISLSNVGNENCNFCDLGSLMLVAHVFLPVFGLFAVQTLPGKDTSIT